jgi:hypothetical protein
MLWQLLVGEKSLGILCVFAGSASIDEVSVDSIELVLSSDDEEVASGQRLLRLTDV